MKYEISRQIKKTRNFMKIRLLGGESFHADGRTVGRVGVKQLSRSSKFCWRGRTSSDSYTSSWNTDFNYSTCRVI